MTLRIEKARPEDAAALTDLVLESKRHWGYDEHLIELWRDDLALTADFIREHDVLTAWRRDRRVGVYALTYGDAGWELEHLWLHPDEIGRGTGRLLMDHAKAALRAAGARRVTIAADPHAEAFYVRMGARRIGEVPSKPEGRSLPLLEMEIP